MLADGPCVDEALDEPGRLAPGSVRAAEFAERAGQPSMAARPHDDRGRALPGLQEKRNRVAVVVSRRHVERGTVVVVRECPHQQVIGDAARPVRVPTAPRVQHAYRQRQR